MLFPFAPPRATTFHMGRVAFPIDVVFADARGRVARVVHAAEPGTREMWAHNACSAVVELRGGACRAAGIGVGVSVRVACTLGQYAQSYNQLRTIVEADPLTDGYYSKEPLGEHDLPREDVPPDERFRDNRLPDESFSEARDQPIPGYRDQWGYQPTEGWDELVGPNVRRSMFVRRAQIADPGQFVAAIVEAMAREQNSGHAPIPWKADVLNGGATESAVVTQRDIARWLSYLSMDSSTRAAALETAVSDSGLQLLADGLVLAELADTTRVKDGTVVLFRGRR